MEDVGDQEGSGEVAVVEKPVSAKRMLIAALGVQAVVLVFAYVGLDASNIDVSWGTGSAASTLSAIAIGLAGAIVSYWIGLRMTLSDTSAGRTLRDLCEKLQRSFRHLSWWQIGALALAAGVCEELLFRGFLQPWLATFSTPLVGLLVASVIFGLLHYASVTYFLITTVIGIVLGAVYWWSESLLAVVVWHITYDLIALGVLAKYPQVLGIQPSVHKV